MQFASQAHQDIYNKIAPWMKELFGSFVRANENALNFSVMMGSAIVQVAVLPWGKENAEIRVFAWIVTEVEMTSELMSFLLQTNNRLRFGAFSIDDKNNIFFQYAIVGSTCDKEELEAAVKAVLMTADEHDDKIVQRWGGKRALDKIRGG